MLVNVRVRASVSARERKSESNQVHAVLFYAQVHVKADLEFAAIFFSRNDRVQLFGRG